MDSSTYADVVTDTATFSENLRNRAQTLVGIARDLIEISYVLFLDSPNARTPGMADSNQEVARRIYRNRRLRAQVFSDETLFGEPAWDLLLDLYIAHSENKRMPVTSACIGAAVPTTTALRWLSMLEQRGLVQREADAKDARRVFVVLTPQGLILMDSFLARAESREFLDDSRRKQIDTLRQFIAE